MNIKKKKKSLDEKFREEVIWEAEQILHMTTGDQKKLKYILQLLLASNLSLRELHNIENGFVDDIKKIEGIK